jgi:hypothetical protein
MERCQFVDHKGKKILVLDCTGCQPEDFDAMIDECARVVQSQPEKSVLTMTIAAGGMFDSATVDKLKNLTKDNAPFVKNSAVVGVTGLQKVVLTAVSLFSNRKFNLFDDKMAAMDFLAAD